MSNPDQENKPDADAYWQPDVDLGGADTVQKTTFVRGAGTEPDRTHVGPIAALSSYGAPSGLLAVLVAISIVVAIVYLIGVAGR